MTRLHRCLPVLALLLLPLPAAAQGLVDVVVEGNELRAGISPGSAVMLATRIFYNYFSVEILFGVKDHFGKGTDRHD